MATCLLRGVLTSPSLLPPPASHSQLGGLFQVLLTHTHTRTHRHTLTHPTPLSARHQSLPIVTLNGGPK